MNIVVTSKDEILKTNRELIQKQGWSAVSIRSVAAACGVSVGSIYNYFKSKEALMSATVESVWCEIFHEPEDGSVFEDTLACISLMYGRMEYGQRKYPGFFTLHSLGFLGNEKSEGRQRMQETWKHISDGLVFVSRDPEVRRTFTEQFPAEKFADVLFSLMLSALLIMIPGRCWRSPAGPFTKISENGESCRSGFFFGQENERRSL